ncbi:MAG: hypothetical protein ACOCNU_02115, partial [Bacteroidales bacterium]
IRRAAGPHRQAVLIVFVKKEYCKIALAYCKSALFRLGLVRFPHDLRKFVIIKKDYHISHIL